ncbi:MAG: HNH endonuclease [Pseudomonadota bacterium]
MPNVEFLPANKCIYCRTSDAELSNEHIVALSLGGKFILPSASCSACSVITAKLEQNFTRQSLGEVRSFYEMPTRRKIERTKFVKVNVLYGKYGPTGEIDIPISEAPIHYIIPSYNVKKRDEDGLGSVGTLTAQHLPNSLQDVKFQSLMRKHKVYSMTVEACGILVGNFERVLWKIVLGIGWHYFPKSLNFSKISEMVLGVKSCLFESDPDGELLLKNIYSLPRHPQNYSDARLAIFTKIDEDHRFIYVEIDFFANLGFPLYFLPNVDTELDQRYDFVCGD